MKGSCSEHRVVRKNHRFVGPMSSTVEEIITDIIGQYCNNEEQMKTNCEKNEVQGNVEKEPFTPYTRAIGLVNLPVPHHSRRGPNLTTN